MAYKFKTVTVNDPTKMLEELRDFLVTDVGWTDESPSGQDDEMGAGDYHGVLGTFLRSAGEDGNQDVCLHLRTEYMSDYTYPRFGASYVHPQFSYLSGTLAIGASSVTVDDDTELVTVPTPFAVRINDEIAIVSSVSSGTVNFSQRGAYGTTEAAHVAGDVILNLSYTRPLIDAYAFRDVTAAIASSSGTSAVGLKSVSAVPGLSGYTDNEFNFHGMLKVVDGTEAGKMRPILDYAGTGGDFTYAPFKTAPGTANVEVVSMGFLPTLSKKLFTAASVRCLPLVKSAEVGTDTVCWFYACKDAVWVITKWDSGYDAFFAGNCIPASSQDTTTSVGTSSAGSNTIEVANRHLFAGGEKFRIISQNAGDWGTNWYRGGTEPNLDAEEIPTEEFVVQSITPGTGDAGTLTLNANLLFTYSEGAVIGEDPRPALTSAYGYNLAGNSITEGVYCSSCVYLPAPKTDIAAHMSHRQSERAVHSNLDKYVYNSTYFNGYGGRRDTKRWTGLFGDYVSGNQDADYYNRLNGRPTGGLVTIYQDAETYSAYGIFYSMKGVLPLCWWVTTEATPPYSAASEDTYAARWGSQYEEFRLFAIRSGGWFIFGPEIE